MPVHPLLALPLKVSEAAELAEVLFPPDARRLPPRAFRSRLAELRLSTIAPHPGSLLRDPVHPSALYLAVDACSEGRAEPLLLRLAPASTPASGLFPNALLIGRIRTARRLEVVVNAIPFSAADHTSIRAFAELVEPAFLPRPLGAQPAIVAGGDFPRAFRAWQALGKSGGSNLASIRGDRDAALWAAIRAGWRQGWSAEADPGDTSADPALYTRFTVRLGEPAAAGLERVAETYDSIRQARMRRPFDFTLSLAASAAPTTAEELGLALTWLKLLGRPAQAVAPHLGSPAEVAELAAVARSFGALLSVEATAGPLDSLWRAAAGHLLYHASAVPDHIQ